MALGKIQIGSTVFLTVAAGLNNQRGGENLMFLKFKSHFREYSESEGSFGGLFGLSIRLLIFSGLISPKKGGFRIHDLISIICFIIFGNFSSCHFLACMPRFSHPYLQFYGIWIQGSGAAGYVASTTYFLNFFEG
jgi:hypothetical protein